MNHHVALVACGAAAASVVAGLGVKGVLHNAAVKATSGVMAASDALNAERQNILDEAADARAEERRQAKIDAAVKEELAAMEDEVREKVTARIDAEGAE